MSQRYTVWCLIFEDTQERNPVIEDDNNKTISEILLSNIFDNINAADGARTGTVNTDSFLLLREGISFEYTVYFTVTGEKADGYCRTMFYQNARRQMIGAKGFTSRRLVITDSHKGKAAWQVFVDRLRSNSYEKGNEITRNVATNRAELERQTLDIPAIGTQDYNKLKIEKLLFDMERRFESGEIRKLPEFVDLLKEQECNEARFKVLEKYILFERAMNFCLVKAEKNLIHRDLRQILKDYVSEDLQSRNINDIKQKIRASGHSHMAEAIVQQFVTGTDKKRNTLVIKGVSNSGKTQFLERLKLIFPSEQYIQQNKSKFEVDYKENAQYDFTKYHPSFILIDEGAYQALFDYGDIADTKRFFEGKGKALQFKGITGTGMHWVGVPIIMAVNHYHYYLQRQTFHKLKYISAHEKIKCIEDEGHRKAFMNRVNFVEVDNEHQGSEDFPYDAFDLAYYLLDLCRQHDMANGLATETLFSSNQSAVDSDGDVMLMQRNLAQLNQNVQQQFDLNQQPQYSEPLQNMLLGQRSFDAVSQDIPMGQQFPFKVQKLKDYSSDGGNVFNDIPYNLNYYRNMNEILEDTNNVLNLKK